MRSDHNPKRERGNAFSPRLRAYASSLDGSASRHVVAKLYRYQWQNQLLIPRST